MQLCKWSPNKTGINSVISLLISWERTAIYSFKLQYLRCQTRSNVVINIDRSPKLRVKDHWNNFNCEPLHNERLLKISDLIVSKKKFNLNKHQPKSAKILMKEHFREHLLMKSSKYWIPEACEILIRFCYSFFCYIQQLKDNWTPSFHGHILPYFNRRFGSFSIIWKLYKLKN